MQYFKHIKKTDIAVTLVLFCIFIVAVCIRNYTLSDNLLFGFEQGRDALKAKGIYDLKDLVLIGPKTDIDGLFHGVWYYYLIAVIYFIVQGNPVHATTVLTVLGSLTCIVVYHMCRELKIGRVLSLGASCIFAFSFNPTVYSRWLSNVSPSILVASLFFLFLIRLWRTRQSTNWIPLFITFGFLFHFELLHGLYGFMVIAVSVILFRIPIRSRAFVIGLVLFCIINAPFLLFELRHNFILTKGVTNYLAHHNLSQKPYYVLVQYFTGLLDEFTTTFGSKIGMIPYFFVGLLAFVYRKYQKNEGSTHLQMILLLVLWSLPYVFLLRDQPLSQFYAGTSVMIVVLVAYLVEQTHKHYSRVVLAISFVVLSVNMISYTMTNLATRSNIFYHAVQSTMTWQTQTQMVDFMYSRGEPFQWEAFTIPYYYSDAYEYLVPWYGAKYYPHTYQRLTSEPRNVLYLIIEPTTAGFWQEKWLSEKNEFSRLISTHTFGELTLQKRLITR